LAQFKAADGPTGQATLLKSWLEALTQSISQFDKKHASLAEAIIDLPWATFDDAFVRVYVRFICVLVAARPEYLKMTLDKAVKAFRWQSRLSLSLFLPL
jgi:RNA polymerase I-specific transcription initiation factor RRN3